MPSAGAFRYATADCSGLASTNPALDVDALIVPAFGRYAGESGDASYRQHGDELFTASLGAWPGNTAQQADKQFNQQYRSARRYLPIGVEPAGDRRIRDSQWKAPTPF